MFVPIINTLNEKKDDSLKGRMSREMQYRN